MGERAWRKIRIEDVLCRPDLRTRVRNALALGPLCDHCLGRLLAAVGTGLSNPQRGRLIRQAIEAPPPPETCSLCGGLFDAVEEWVPRAVQALEGWELATFAVTAHADPQIEAQEAQRWQHTGADLAEPYKQAFNRLLGIRLCNATGLEPDLEHPDIYLVADHAAGQVTLRVEPLFAHGRYRKLARGFPQCRWRGWPTSIQQIIGDPVCREARGQDHAFHGCGREDTDVRCLGARPFVVEVLRPRRRSLDWAALAQDIGRSEKVEVLDLARCRRDEVARLKGLRPEKTYRATVRLAADADAAACERLAGLVGEIAQQTPNRVLKRRPDLRRRRRVHAVQWRQLDPRTLELEVRAQAGTYIKELISGDGGRTRPSVTEVLGTAALCVELDVLAIHLH